MLDPVLPKFYTVMYRQEKRQEAQHTVGLGHIQDLYLLFIRTHLSEISLQPEYRTLILVLLNKDQSCGERGEGCE